VQRDSHHSSHFQPYRVTNVWRGRRIFTIPAFPGHDRVAHCGSDERHDDDDDDDGDGDGDDDDDDGDGEDDDDDDDGCGRRRRRRGRRRRRSKRPKRHPRDAQDASSGLPGGAFGGLLCRLVGLLRRLGGPGGPLCRLQPS